MARFRWDGLYARPLAWPEGAVGVWHVEVIGSRRLLAKKAPPNFASAQMTFCVDEFAYRSIDFRWQVAGFGRITEASALARLDNRAAR